MTERTVNTVTIITTGAYFRRQCVACGNTTDKNNIYPILEPVPELVQAERPICDECLEAGPDGIGVRILAHAEHLEHFAGHLRELAEQPWELPTPQALEDARHLFEVEFLEGGLDHEEER